MEIAIYSRKSKITNKGESIENQIQLCTDYALLHYPDAQFHIYEDEGFSGKNTDRPQFKQLIKDAKANKFQIIICYRLDRISRNVADFSSLIDELNDFNIGFVSIKEQFDTTTPMGRAMMYISSVFAQLERETIAERIRDNMYQLAKTGRWLGGTTPPGYTSIPIKYDNKTMYQLVPIEEEVTIVQMLYRKFLETQSVYAVECYCIEHDIKTRQGNAFHRSVLKKVLSNPVYVIADQVICQYLLDNGCHIYNMPTQFNQKDGLAVYNKTEQKKTSKIPREMSEWIVAIGAHPGIINSNDWIQTQTILKRNEKKSTWRRVKSTTSLLSGILRCANCGDYMRPKGSRTLKDGSQAFYYMCELKEKSHGTKCNVKNIQGHKLDTLVSDEIIRLGNQGQLKEKIRSHKVTVQQQEEININQLQNIEEQIQTLEQEVNSLAQNFRKELSDFTAKLLSQQLDALGEQLAALQAKQTVLQSNLQTTQANSQSLDIMNQLLQQYTLSGDLPTVERRNLLRTIIDKVTWDGENIDIQLFNFDTGKKY